MEGTIIKGIGGFYYVEAEGQLYECKARGKFRNEGIKPLAGDKVTISINDKAENTIDAILPRKNSFLRPPVANVDNLVIIASMVEPDPVLLNIDKLTIFAVEYEAKPIIIFTKCDIKECNLTSIYTKAGIKCFAVSSQTGEGIEQLKEEISDGITVFCGNSGVGKSTLINKLIPDLNLKTAPISKKLGRGKHTTRESELFKFNNGYIADTPGFSSFDFDSNGKINPENLQFCFPEFLPFLGKCKFSTCRHINDKGCKIKEAVDSGIISYERYKSYCFLREQS